jgi:polyisoprenoid-binding protein YceI
MPAIDSASGASIAPPGVWSIDSGRSSVGFAVRHMLATLRGCFGEFERTARRGPERRRKAFGSVNDR